MIRGTARGRPLLLALALAGGCASRADVNQAASDDIHLTTRVMGFALDAQMEALRTQLALLRALEGDPRRAALEAELGTPAAVEAKIERVEKEKLLLIEEAQRLRRRYAAE